MLRNAGARLILISMLAAAASCASPSSGGAHPQPLSSDCTTALAAPATHVALQGGWAGTAVKDGKTTSIKLQIVDGQAFASMPERAQIDYPVRAAVSPDGQTLCVSAPHRSGSWRLQRHGGAWAGVWTDPDFQAQVSLAAVNLPALPRERELDFSSADGARLAGTLVLPPRGRGPFPIIVWVHGSTSVTRDVWYYRGRAHLLARQGVASLIWDKRGSGQSTGERAFDIDLLTQDAQAAIDAARAAPEINRNGVIIAGFSQGGWIAPRIAAANPWLAGVLVGAAPSITIAEQNVYSFEQALHGANIPAETTERAVTMLRATYEYYRTGQGYAALQRQYADPANQAIVGDSFFRNMLFRNGDLPGPDIDPADWTNMFVDYLPYWRRVDAPVLAMWGEDDNEVPATLSRDQISAALAGHGSSDKVLVILPHATHALYVDQRPGDAWDWERTAPGFQEDIASWIRRRMARSR